jgi:hypothetical protein
MRTGGADINPSFFNTSAYGNNRKVVELSIGRLKSVAMLAPCLRNLADMYSVLQNRLFLRVNDIWAGLTRSVWANA